jgi:hypothetical protein
MRYERNNRSIVIAKRASAMNQSLEYYITLKIAARFAISHNDGAYIV